MRFPWPPLVLVLVLTVTPFARAQEDAALAARTRAVFETHCHRCHGKDGAREGGVGYILDADRLIQRKKVVPGKLDEGLIVRVMAGLKGDEGGMPPPDEKPRPSEQEVEVLKEWILKGATAFPTPRAVAQREALVDADVYRAMHRHLLSVPATEARYWRFFTLAHLHNAASVSDEQLRYFRAGVAKLLNSLSWRRRLASLVPIDPAGAVLAFDLRDLDWDRGRQWDLLVGSTAVHNGYPYALTRDSQADETLARLAAQVYAMTGTRVPAVRADWFVATAAVAPLYHDLLGLPGTAQELERRLGVDRPGNFVRDRVARAGFTDSGVSANANRLIERSEAAHGAYWISDDFRSGEGAGNLARFPLGPAGLFPVDKHPFLEHAYQPDGGEIIFHLPNGLQGYMLVTGAGQRIDVGPPDVVRDRAELAGRGPLIVNALSCIGCHKHGMIRESVKDEVRLGAGVQGDLLAKVRRLYPPREVMDRILSADEALFLDALDRTIRPFFKDSALASQKIETFAEPVTFLASPFLKQSVTLEVAARELGIDPQELRGAIRGNSRLQQLGLRPLSEGGAIKREVWEGKAGVFTLFQETAAELQLGTPIHIRR